MDWFNHFTVQPIIIQAAWLSTDYFKHYLGKCHFNQWILIVNKFDKIVTFPAIKLMKTTQFLVLLY